MSRKRRISAAFVAAAAALLAAGWAWYAKAPPPGPPLAYRYMGAPMVAREPAGEPAALMVIVADRPGDPRAAAIAQSLLASDIAYTMVALPDLAPAIRASADCANFSRILHAVAKDAEHRLGMARFRVPLVGGTGRGALAAYLAYRQTAAGMWAGVLTVDAAPTISLARPPCYGWGESAGNGTYRVPMQAKRGDNRLDLANLPPGDPGKGLAPLIANIPRPSSDGDLPVTLVTPARPDPAAPLVVMISGDGGWAGFDRQVAAEFSRRGYPVAGLSSLAYFWQPRTPAESAAAVQSIVDAHGQGRRVLLVGYSFGADVLPFIYDSLPAETKARVVRVNLLGLSKQADFEFHLSSWADVSTSGARATVPFVDAMRGVAIRCIRGATEAESACPAIENPAVRKVTLPGDHHFGNDAVRVVNALTAS